MKVTKAKGFNTTPYGSFCPLRTTLPLGLELHVHWDCWPFFSTRLAAHRLDNAAAAGARRCDAKRASRVERESNNPNERGCAAEVAVLSAAGQNEPYGFQSPLLWLLSFGLK
jgi:hypothetical protein